MDAKTERELFKVPDSYDGPFTDRNGNHHYDFCDSTITVDLKKMEAHESHMGCGDMGHYFTNTLWVKI